MYKVDEKKWKNFSADTQLKNIAVELSRATNSVLHQKDESFAKSSLERAISLIDASISDPKWNDKSFLYQLRDAVASLYSQKYDPSLTNFIYKRILEKCA